MIENGAPSTESPTGDGRRSVGGPALPRGIAGDPALESVWHAIGDPVAAELPGEGRARVARAVAAFHREVESRGRFGSLYPAPIRLAAAAAPIVGLVLGLSVTRAVEEDPVRLEIGRASNVAMAPAEPTPVPVVEADGEADAPEPGEAADLEQDDGASPLEEGWGGFAPPLLAELYLEDLGLSDARGSEPIELDGGEQLR
jgi:hypothetical protein